MKRTLALGSLAFLAYRFFKGKKEEEEQPPVARRARRSTRSRSGSRAKAKAR